MLSRDTSAPTAVVAVYYNIGFRIEPKDRTGFAHLFEHMMFQGSENLGKNEFIGLVAIERRHPQRLDALRLHELLRDRPAHTLETILWAEADRMRGLDITQENLTNQQGVVKNEVKVNVLNQPYGGFPWLDLPQFANTNWYNAHNFYGDLAAPRRGDARRRAAVLQDLLRAEQRGAGGDRRHRSGRRRSAGSRSTSPAFPRRQLPPQPDISEPRQEKEKRSNREDALATRPALALGYHLPPRNTPEYYAMGLIDQILVQGQDSRLYQALVQKRGLTGEVSGGSNPGSATCSTSTGRCSGRVYLIHDSDKPADEILKVIDEEVARLQNTPVDQGGARPRARQAALGALRRAGAVRRASAAPTCSRLSRSSTTTRRRSTGSRTSSAR